MQSALRRERRRTPGSKRDDDSAAGNPRVSFGMPRAIDISASCRRRIWTTVTRGAPNVSRPAYRRFPKDNSKVLGHQNAALCIRKLDGRVPARLVEV